jgi:alpha-L-fucosidase 2
MTTFKADAKITMPTTETRAHLHAIEHEGPAEDFFEGALLGNGGLGCVVTTRPDAIALHFGHNDVWDARIPDPPESDDDSFAKVLKKLKAVPASISSLRDDPWYETHFHYNFSRYGKIYPRPFPCGTVVLGFDRRHTEVLGHRLRVSDGLLSIELLHKETRLVVELFAEALADRVALRTVDGSGNPAANPFVRVAVYRDPTTPDEFPDPEFHVHPARGVLSFVQRMLSSRSKSTPEPDYCGLAFRCSSALEDRRTPLNVNHPDRYRTAVDPDFEDLTQSTPPLEKYFPSTDALTASIALLHPAGTENDGHAGVEAPDMDWAAAWQGNADVWDGYWSASSIELDDEFLESIWYRNLYFLRCVLRPGTTCPGIFGNWMFGNIGTAWHGDFHLNYNTQQLFWGCFSSNHPELHLPYVHEVNSRMLPLGRAWARDYYEMSGACLPYCAVPVDMEKPLLLGADWSWGVGISAWIVQSLWWHYRYTADREFLATEAFPAIRDVTRFITDFLSRPECRSGAAGDERIHVFPSLSQELYRLRPGFRFNRDGILDLCMIRFLMRAYLQAADLVADNDPDLHSKAVEILARLAPYPTAISEAGDVWVSMPGESADVIHNAPQPLMPVFPCDEVDLQSPGDVLEHARRTYRGHLNEGGNDLVFLHLQAARLGCLDLERFKRQIRYCLLPNGTCTDMNLIAGGRHGDLASFSFMKRMGIWVENFALPAVINECLMHGHSGTIQLFPNWPCGDASFRDLRAAGGLLISATRKNNSVMEIQIRAESGGLARIHNPWQCALIHSPGMEPRVVKDRLVEIDMPAGGICILVELQGA